VSTKRGLARHVHGFGEEEGKLLGAPQGVKMSRKNRHPRTQNHDTTEHGLPSPEQSLEDRALKRSILQRKQRGRVLWAKLERAGGGTFEPGGYGSIQGSLPSGAVPPF